MTGIARGVVRTCIVLAGTLSGMRAVDAAPVDQFIVHYQPSANGLAAKATRRSLLDAIGHSHGVRLESRRTLAGGGELVRSDRTIDAATTARLLARLRRDPRVASARIDGWLRPAATPNDLYFPYQWPLHHPAGGIRAPAAWERSTGAGVVVAVVDTGVTVHSDLDANMLPGYDFISDPAVAGDGNGRDADAHDDGDYTNTNECGPGIAGTTSSWHGTEVAGAIAAIANNSIGLVGVAFSSRVVPVRAIGRCGGHVSDIADAVAWASGAAVAGVPANPEPADIINLSMSGPGACDPLLQGAINQAVATGVVVVAAAGNDGIDAGGASPGNCANVITVGGSRREGTRWTASNGGAYIDVVAPAANDQGFYVVTNAGSYAPSTPWYWFSDEGTSLSAAQVSATVALMQAAKANPPATVAAIVRNTAREVPGCAADCGGGLLDSDRAVQAAVTPGFFIDDASIVEGDSGGSELAFALRLAAPQPHPVTFNVGVRDGGARSAEDYNFIGPQPVTLLAGETRRDILVQIRGDLVDGEGNETFIVEATDLVGAPALDLQATGTIVDDDARVLTNGQVVADLGVSPGTVQWFRLDVPPGATAFHASFHDGRNYGSPAYISIHLGAKNGPSVGGCYSCGGNNIFRRDQPPMGSYYIALVASGGSTVGSLVARYELATVSLDDITVREGDGGSRTVVTAVRLSSPVHDAVSVTVAFSGDTATAVQDFGPDARYVTIPGGARGQSVPVEIVGDTVAEANESFRATITSTTGPAIGDAQGDVRVLNDDGPVLTVGGTALSEGNAGTKLATFTVRLSQAAAVPVTYSISTAGTSAQAGSDFDPVTLVAYTIPAGMTAQAVSVPVFGDAVAENNETFAVTLSSASGATILHGVGVATILNDDGPQLSILDASVAEGQAGTRVMTFTARLSQATAERVYFFVTTENRTAQSGSDYTPLSSVYREIPAGQLATTIEIAIQGDTAIEGNDTFVANVSSASGATVYDGQAIGTIYNDDGPTLSINDVAISEGNAGTKVATFTVSLSQAAAVPVTYDVATSNRTATAGTDYGARALAGETIPAGQLSKTFTVTLNGDTGVEANETFRVTLSNISAGATLFKHIGTGTITNDD